MSDPPVATLRQRERLVAAAAASAVAGVLCMPAFLSPESTGATDWQMIHHNWEAAFIALTRHGEWPLWDPYHCGGISIASNPESQLLSPLFPLSFLVGTVLAVKLFVWAHLAAALLGMYLLARRRYEMEPVVAAFVALAWGFSGCIAWDVRAGHATLLPFVLAPWLVLAWRRALESPRHAAAVAAVLCLVLFEGGTYPFAYFVLLLGFELARELGTKRGALIALRRGGVAAVLVAFVAAVRWIPIAQELARTPRDIASTDSLSPLELVHMLLEREVVRGLPGKPFSWHEYGSYVGPVVVVLGLLGLVAVLRSGPRHLTAGAVLFGALTLGNLGPLAPWSLLHALPVYDSLRVPSRFAVLFTFFLALAAGGLAQRAVVAIRRLRAGKILAQLFTGLLVLSVADTALVNAKVADPWHGAPLFSGEPERDFHLVQEGEYYVAYASYPRRNVGTPRCYWGAMEWRVAPGLWTGDVAQVRVEGAPGRVHAFGRSTRRVWADVEVDGPARVVFNQNHAPGWTSNAGAIASDAGRLAVDVPRGHHRIEARYAPPNFAWALALSALGLILLTLVATSRGLPRRPRSPLPKR